MTGPTRTDSVRTRVARRIEADPTSTALLLAGPTAIDLWPGTRRVGEAGGRVLVEAALEGAPPTAAAVRALPPRRTPTAYVTCFEWVGPGLPMTAGTLTLGCAPSARGALGTSAVLELDSAGLAGSRLDEARLSAQAARFLANLAAAAEARRDAA